MEGVTLQDLLLPMERNRLQYPKEIFFINRPSLDSHFRSSAMHTACTGRVSNFNRYVAKFFPRNTPIFHNALFAGDDRKSM